MTTGTASHAIESLRFAVRVGVLLRFLGQLFVPLAVLTVAPLLVCLLHGETSVALRYLIVIGALLSTALLTRRLPKPEELQTNEAMAVTALVFTAFGILMSYPLMGYGLPFEDALFEAVSGVTTTGLSTLESVEERSPPFLFARAWFQWVGGLGVVVLALALLIHPGAAAKRLGFEKREKNPLVGGTRAHARRVLLVYAALTILGVLLLVAAGAAPFTALVHALAAVSTGGFSSSDQSLAPLGPGLQAAILLVSLSGAISFSWYYSGFHKRVPELVRDVQFRTLLAAILVVGALLFATSSTPGGGLVAAKNALFMAVSAQTTTGFSTTAVSEMGDASKLVLVVSMLIGGEIGSTAGGVKVFRFLVLLRLLSLTMLRPSIQRGGLLRVWVGGDAIESAEIESVVGVSLSYLAVLVTAWLAFLALGHAPLDALFDVSSALGTVGLSTGVVGPGLEPGLKGLLTVVMLVGRVETCAFLLLLYPGTWLGKKRAAK